MSEKGWVKIDRKIIDHWVWDDRPFSKGQAWIDLLLLANFKEKKFIRKNEVVEGKRGCVYESILGLSRRWGWSREKTTRFLKQLESDGMVRINATRQQTTITLVNYGIYQD